MRRLRVCSVDVDVHRPVAKSFAVSSVPFVTLLRRGAWFTWDEAAGEPVPLPAARFEGALAADAVAAWLSSRRACRLLTRSSHADTCFLRSTGLAVQLPTHVEELTPDTLLEAQRDTASDVLIEFYGTGCAQLFLP